ncbi:TIGR04076 family protein [candidate division KSB1 bacterium]
MCEQKADNNVKRREFCTALSCAAVGLFTVPKLVKNTNQKSFQEQLLSMEDGMQDTITGVKLKVISQEGSCASGHKVGDETTITEFGVDGKICIHALYSVMPKVFAFLYDAEFPWLSNPDISTHACPDAYNPVVFQVEKIRE